MEINLVLVVIGFYFTYVKADDDFLKEKTNIDYNSTNQFFNNVNDDSWEEKINIDYNWASQFFDNVSSSSKSNPNQPTKNESIKTTGNSF